MERMSFVKACQTFFTEGQHGRKIEIPEFRALSHEDKLELREMLIGEGYDVMEIGEVTPV